MFHLSICEVMDEPLPARNGANHVTGPVGLAEEENAMKKSWKKPTMCQVAAGFEISRYLPAEIPPRK